MQKPFYETQSSLRTRELSSAAAEIPKAPFQRVTAIAQEIQAELETLAVCPAVCEDGKVNVSPPSGTSRRVRCPLLRGTCPYGNALSGKLDLSLCRFALNAGVPGRHIGNFGTCIETPALVWTSQWRFYGFLVLSGGSGVGKSFSAAWVFRKWLRSKIPDPLDFEAWNLAARASEHAMWITANRIIHDKEKLDEARNRWFLVLDDFGREGDLATRRADVSDIVSARYDAKLATVITTELGFDGILRAYGRNTAYKLVENDVEKSGMFAYCGDVSLRQETVNVLGLDDE